MNENERNTITMEEAEQRRRERAKAREIRRRRRLMAKRICIAVLALIIVILAVVLITKAHKNNAADGRLEALASAEAPSWVEQQILPLSAESRRGDRLEDFTAVVIHYVGNPATTAQQNRDYYGNAGTKVSSHFLVGLDGEIIQCVPLDEKSSASGERNRDTISIEVCHPDESGRFSDEAYASLVKLAAWLCDLGGLDTEKGVIRHYDVSGKLCPLYYVENEDAWQQLLDDIDAARAEK